MSGDSVEPARRCRFPIWVVAIMATWLALVGAYEFVTRDVPDAPSLCVFKRFTDQPCPTCGTTRIVYAIGRGDVLAALRLNPFVVAAMIGGIAWCVWRLMRKRRPQPLSPRAQRLIWIIIAVLFFANWVYLIAAGI